MARRVFLPTTPPPASQAASRSILPPPPGLPRAMPSQRPPSSARSVSMPPPPSTRSLPPPPSIPAEARISVPPLADGVPMPQVIGLLDRLAAMDESAFIVTWVESIWSGRGRLDPSIAVRLLRAYRETGRLDKTRDIAAQLPSSPAQWNPLDVARLALERAAVSTADGRADHAEAELRAASRALTNAPRGAGLREQLDLHIITAELELGQNRIPQAQSALRLAEHVADRLEEGAWRIPVGMSLGHLAMRLADPKAASKHYTGALSRSPGRSHNALRAHGNLAIALASSGKFDEGRDHALTACSIASEISAGYRHADACDVLAVVETAADRPDAALDALDEAVNMIGENEQQPQLRYQLASHRAWVLAVLGRTQSAKQWLGKTEIFYSERTDTDQLDELEMAAVRARVAEACEELQEALDLSSQHAEILPDAYISGSLNLICGRTAYALGLKDVARAAIERLCLAGDKYGWVFPERSPSTMLWDMALKSGDSRVVRYAEKIVALMTTGLPPPSIPPPPRSVSVAPPSHMHMMDRELAIDSFGGGETLIYVTTPLGVTRVRLSELKNATAAAGLVVDTIAHALRVDDREVSLERRRALEPLVVQLLRRAKDGLSAEEILRAAGGPGPESADAEHRVRVLISRVRDLIGDPTAIERVRDAGEHGKTRYRLAPSVNFALVEPLSTG